MYISATFKRFCLLSLFIVTTIVTAQAQTNYGNEWINYEQTYHKIKVTSTGLHQLNYTYLSQLGLEGVNPQNLQLFRRGKEVAVYIAGEQDGKLDPQDYLEFYGERNDGALDAELYKDPSHQPHQFYSLYTDTAAYFLTFSTVKGKRMQQNNPEVTGKTPEPYHLQQALFMYTNRYYTGKTYNDNRMPWLDAGEGYASHSSRYPKTFNNSGTSLLTNVVTTGPKPQLEYAVVTTNEMMHEFTVKVTSGSTPRQIELFRVFGDDFAKSKTALEFTDFTSSGQLNLYIERVGPDITADQVGFVYGNITYPQATNFPAGQRQLTFFTDPARGLSPYYEVKSSPGASVAYDVTDPYNPVRIAGYSSGSGKGFVIDGNTTSRKVLVADASNPWRPVQTEKNIRFRKITPSAHNYIILTNKRLMKKVAGESLRAPEAFAAYRASDAGGGYDTLLVHMDQVIDQFHYGEFSVNSIRRFMSFMLTSNRAKHLFIIGKGVKYGAPEYQEFYGGRFSYYHIGGRNPKVYEIDLVPTGLAPVSDVFFTADFKNNSFSPEVPTGRLAAIKAEDVINYLNKVKAYEALPEGLPWRKNILQLGGGTTVSEINQIANYLKKYKNIAEGIYLGANVIEKYRQNVSEVVETINVANEINAGVSLLTFFGHSSPSTTDLDIGLVSSALNGYNNKDKYPVILMNGCSTGDAFIPNNRSFGEDWVNTADKGAIAFIAHAESGYPYYLDLYSTNFYSTAFQDPAFYGKTLGEVQQQVIKRTLQSNPGDVTKAMVMEMVLQGDPAVKIYNPSKPDYAAIVNEADIEGVVPGEVLTAAAEKFNLIVGVRNWGKALPDSVGVTVKRILADNTELAPELFKVAPIYYKDKIVLEIDNRGVTALGMNQFEVTLDGDFKFDELDETNNVARFQYFFPANGLIALAPANFSIESSKNVKIVAQTTLLQESRQGFYLEIDTTYHFNSALKRSFTTDNSLVPTWDVDVSALGNLPDSTVYYWRARFQHYEAGEDTLYASSSFRVINGSRPGWSQSHIGQFKTIETDKVIIQEPKPHFSFIPGVADVSIKTIGGDFRYTRNHGLYLNDKQLLGVSCDYPESSTTSRLYMVVINDKTLELVKGLPFATPCTGYEYLYQFKDMNNATVRANVESFLKQVPVGYYVAVISINKVAFESFTENLRNEFRTIGAKEIGNLKNGHPYALLGRKGAEPGTMYEVVADPSNPTVPSKQEIALRVTLKSNQQAGEITSAIIGPALSWGSVHHNIEKYKAGNDDYTLRVIGINTEGNATVLVDNVPSKNFDISNIDAKVYPHLQLEAALSDATDRSAPQLDQWLVFYEVAPEGVIRPDLVEVSSSIISEQANKGKMKVPMLFQNVSSFAFKDSLAVDVTVTGDGIEPIQKRLKLAPLAANTSATFNFEMDTHTLDGNYKLSIYVNPRIQPEQHYFNNIYVVPFKAKSRLHPIMDVAFDGVHIMDGELISPSPMVSITVKDENKQAFLSDASGMSVILVDPNGNQQEIALDKTSELVEYVEVFPATEKSDFRVEFKPAKLEDGVYTMEVRAKDVSGKQSGISPYRINFEVENRSSITNFYPFPNPFSTKTNFIFTLTGATIPDHIKIQILTITGKVVKEIMKEELGPLRIGNNKTEYAWDGTDMYGDKLANGVYLYRVVVSRGDEMMYHKQKFGDKAFKNGYGKIYILR
ncbi:putative type IX secretion system sortase PorU2 [Pontibacter pudoricolor]|uniref:putative type IX secretion system sortase PorU2 n=1 Tax=Pontibacter pudoricolor TaxID=2694930 RepID=UPI00139172E8|nr:C25 family cysteine peptidase [Pontibacter pudoricolor]